MAGPLRGSQGGAAFKWDGNGTTTVNAAEGTSCAALYFHAEIEILNVKCHSADTSGCFTASSGAVILFAAPASTCNPGLGQGFVADDPGSKIYFVDTGFNFGAQAGVASAVTVFSALNGRIITFEHAETIKFLGDVKFSEANFVIANLGGIFLSGTKFDTGGFTITGLRFFCGRFSVLGAGSSPNKVIPGSVDGIIGSDCKSF